MTQLRRRMTQDMKLRGFSEKTQASYLGAVRQVAKYYMRSPDRLSEEELRGFFLWLVQDRQASPSTVRQYLCGIKFLYEHTLPRDWPTLSLVRPAKRRALPVVLSREEVGDLLGRVKIFKHRVALNLIYACGLRLLEGTRLHVTDVDLPEIADVLRRHGPAYRDRYAEKIPRSHRRAMADLAACRTEALGGQIYQCDRCGRAHPTYHSCRNRSCPKCHRTDILPTPSVLRRYPRRRHLCPVLTVRPDSSSWLDPSCLMEGGLHDRLRSGLIRPLGSFESQNRVSRPVFPPWLRTHSACRRITAPPFCFDPFLGCRPHPTPADRYTLAPRSKTAYDPSQSPEAFLKSHTPGLRIRGFVQQGLCGGYAPQNPLNRCAGL